MVKTTPSGRAYSMRLRLRSNKLRLAHALNGAIVEWPPPISRQAREDLDGAAKPCSRSAMGRHPVVLSRRDMLVGIGGLAGAATLPPLAATGARADGSVTLRLAAGEAALGAAKPSPVWEFLGGSPSSLTQGETAALTLVNDLPVPAVLGFRSLDGAPSLEPLLSTPPVAPGQSVTLPLPLRQAGTMLCDARLLGDGQLRPLPACGWVVQERRPPAVDADHLVTINDWRIQPDGTPVGAGDDAANAAIVFTANGVTNLDIPVRRNARLRFRFINACHRAVTAIKLENHEVRVMAIDGRPAAPFVARDGQLMLAPGTRIDALVDATAPPGSTARLWLHDGVAPRPLGRLVYDAEPVRPTPLPPPAPLENDGAPERLALSAAQRIELALDIAPGSGPAGWRRPAAKLAASAPAFRARRGSTVVLALVNRAATPVTFHLHGHHVRWLDRLDDGWKPFWLDTLLLPGGQTIRVAFMAEFAGAWLLEAMGTDWAAPRLVRWYAVD